MAWTEAITQKAHTNGVGRYPSGLEIRKVKKALTVVD